MKIRHQILSFISLLSSFFSFKSKAKKIGDVHQVMPGMRRRIRVGRSKFYYFVSA